MAANDEVTDAPPVGEEIHMPGASLLPIINAAGISLAIVSITISLVGVILGVIVFLLSGAIWIRDARKEMDDLPLEHHGPA
jgi:hypothetical protein